MSSLIPVSIRQEINQSFENEEDKSIFTNLWTIFIAVTPFRMMVEKEKDAILAALQLLITSYKIAKTLIPLHNCLRVFNKHLCNLFIGYLTIYIFWILYNNYYLIFKTSDNAQVIVRKYYESMHNTVKHFFKLCINDLKYEGLNTYISLSKDLVKVTEYTKSYTEGLFFTYGLQNEARIFLSDSEKIEEIMSQRSWVETVKSIVKLNPPQSDIIEELGKALTVIPYISPTHCIKGSLNVMTQSIKTIFTTYNIVWGELFSKSNPYMTLSERINEIPVKTIDLFLEAANRTNSEVLKKFCENRVRWEVLRTNFRDNTRLFMYELEQEYNITKSQNKDIFMQTLLIFGNVDITINLNSLLMIFIVMVILVTNILSIKFNRNIRNDLLENTPDDDEEDEYVRGG